MGKKPQQTLHTRREREGMRKVRGREWAFYGQKVGLLYGPECDRPRENVNENQRATWQLHVLPGGATRPTAAHFFTSQVKMIQLIDAILF